MNPHLDDTIVAISTPPGRGGIGVVRLSGEQAVAIVQRLVRTPSGKDVEFREGHAAFSILVDEDGERIDEAVVTYFQKPHSYTTDDVVEISSHGSPVVLRHIVECAIGLGARLAEPGEFTMRAFLRGRLDLTQAEAVRDLIDSQTIFQAKTAAQQLSGSVSKRIQPIKRELMNLIAALEAGVDFAEDDVAVLADDEIQLRIEEVRGPLAQLSDSIGYGKKVQQGIMLAIVGRPNVGKSSLFNRLVEREHAIVTATPGTTRDLVSETVSIGGFPVKLFDTAGLRKSDDEAEKIGIQKSHEALADADVVLVVVEAANGELAEDKELIRSLEERGATYIVVENKSDLAQCAVPERAAVAAKRLRTSAIRGDGINELRSEVLAVISGSSSPRREPGFLTTERQHASVKSALAGLAAAQQAVHNRVPHEVLLLDMYSSLQGLDALTGQTSSDEILALIFSGFCIGK